MEYYQKCASVHRSGSIFEQVISKHSDQIATS